MPTVDPGDTQFQWGILNLSITAISSHFYGSNEVTSWKPRESEFVGIPIWLQPKTLRLSQVGEQMRQFEANWADCSSLPRSRPTSPICHQAPPHPSPCGPATFHLIQQDPTLQRVDTICPLYLILQVSLPRLTYAFNFNVNVLMKPGIAFIQAMPKYQK